MIQTQFINRKRINCPFCEGDIDGCCFCDHTGKISVGGENDFFKNQDFVNNSLGVKFLKEMDKKQGTETWPEMIEYFLNDNNVPKWYQQEQ
jgi:hypothetical protein